MTKKPNIIIIVLDAWRAINLKMYGYKHNTAPFLESFLKKATLFKNMYSTVDQTDPSFTTIMTGKYPISHGITKHGPDLKEENLRILVGTNTKLLTEILNKNGYKAYAVDWLGRWHKRGYTTYAPPSELLSPLPKNLVKILNNTGIRLTHRTRSWEQYKKTYERLRRIGFCYDYNGFCTIEAGIKLLNHHLSNYSNKSFFLLMHFWDTHTPFHDIPRFLMEKYYDGTCNEKITAMAKRIKNEKWRYLTLKYHLKGIKCVDEIEPYYNASITNADQAIKNLIQWLDNKNLMENTFIIITGDHGENLVRNNIFIGHGGLFQRVIRVPLIIHGPEIPEGKIIDSLVQHVDIVPTILDYLEIHDSILKWLDGTSLKTVLEDGHEIREHALVFSSTAPRRHGIIKGKYKYIYSPTPEDAMDKFGGIWMNSVKELYDLSKDSDDRYNLYEEEKDIAEEMETLLKNEIKKLIRKRTRAMILSKIQHSII